tara:strand:+ start:3432 stop:4838 length:1407 start_codon:yes stop_codon:yes gene_type:complete
MAFTRQERTLSGRKSNLPLIRKGIPDSREGFHGDIAFIELDGIGIVQYVKIENNWKRVGFQETFATTQAEVISNEIKEKEDTLSDSDFIHSDGSVPFTGNQSHGGNNITNVGSLDVDGATTLDQVTIDTTDGDFLVSGGNDINLTTTANCDWNTATLDWDNSSTFNLTSLGDSIINATGVEAAPKTITIQGGDSGFSGSAFGYSKMLAYNKISEDGSITDNFDTNGIEIKADAGNTSAKHNNILIQQYNTHSKGSGYGVMIKSSNGIYIDSVNNNQSQNTAIIMQATGTIDIGLSTSSALSPNTNQARTKIHGVSEVETLYRPASDGTAHTDNHYPINTATHSVKFDHIDTFKLLRATTYLASNTSLSNSSSMTIVHQDNDDNLLGTVWMVTVYWKHSTTKKNLQVFWVYFTSSSSHNIVKVVEDLNGSTTAGVLSWTSGGGIVWTNQDTQNARVHASALKIQGSNDF